MNMFFSMLISLLLIAGTAFGHGTTATTADIALDYKLGQNLPADMVFLDENGRRVNLRETIDRPTIIAPVYLSCMHECPMLLTGLAGVLGKLELVKPGKDFKVITLSFDDKDTPAIALDKKRNYLKAVGRAFPAEALDVPDRRRRQRSKNSPTPSASSSSGTANTIFPIPSRSWSWRRAARSSATWKESAFCPLRSPWRLPRPPKAE